MTESRRRWVLPAGACVVSAVLVATAFNPVPHSGGDNSVYVSLAHGLLTEAAYADVYDPARAAHTKYPPVFPLVLAALIGLGAHSWVALKSVAALSTVAAVGLTFLWAERRLGALPALAVSFVLALSSAVVYYSHWVLSDTLFLALTLAALVALERATPGARPIWLGLGVAAAGLAFFTRSAGLPLVVALLAWLTLGRRWRAVAVAGAAIGVPALGWWWRARGAGVASYATEFWMVDPYQPALGTVGVFGLLPRLWDNLGAYVLVHAPGGVVGQDMIGLAALGVALAVAAVSGWVLSARSGIGPVELFFPLYAGLILLWPQVWAGDRFVLPLYPVAFVYGATSLRRATARMPAPVAPLVALAIVFALAVPAGRGWLDQTREASACARAAREGGPFACYGPGVTTFVEAARWAGRALPEGAAVLTRKPGHFYVLSGVPSRTFAFDTDPSVHLRLADELGVRYVLLDQWDGLAGRYVGGAIGAWPTAFCFVRAFGDTSTRSAQLFGILPPAARGRAGSGDGETVRVAACPGQYTRPGADYASSVSPVSGAIPLLAGPES